MLRASGTAHLTLTLSPLKGGEGIRGGAWRRVAAVALAWLLASRTRFGAGARSRVPMPQLRVCADPSNLPFSNQQGEGFENKIAQIIGQDLGVPVSYVLVFPRSSASYATRCARTSATW